MNKADLRNDTGLGKLGTKMVSDRREFAEMVERAPDLERLVSPGLRSLPWVKLFAYRALPKSTYEKMEETLSARGLDKTSLSYRTEWEHLFQNELKEHKRNFVEGVSDDEVQKIVDWIIARDSAYPELVRQQIEYWRRPPGNTYHSNGAFTVDVGMIDFWDFSYDLFSEKSITLTAALVPEFLTNRVEHGIAQYYLTLALQTNQDKT